LSRFKLTIEYAGTRYRGWQSQRNARSVHDEIAGVVRKVAQRQDFELKGSGRTDAGVHALGQVAHLDLNTRLTPEALRFALNDNLPADIHVLRAQRVPRSFHARHDARARSYLYQVSRRRTALLKPYVWWIKDPLALSSMRAAAAQCVGLHDFQSFTEVRPDQASTRVAIDRLEIAEQGALILFRVQASHFLWKLVRRLVGVLAEVGRGKLGARDVRAFLEARSDTPARFTAPPSGLFLERVLYDDEACEGPLRPALFLDLEGR
jgi:tRNA pseudouridine38-40 synthase